MAQNFAFFPSPTTSFALFLSLCVSSRGFLVVFGSAGAVKCAHLEFSGCCEAPAVPKKLRFHTTAREPKRAHLRAGTSKHHQNSTRRHTVREKERNWWGETEKKPKFLAVRRRGVRWRGACARWSKPFTTPPTRTKITNNNKHNTNHKHPTNHNNTQQHTTTHNNTAKHTPTHNNNPHQQQPQNNITQKMDWPKIDWLKLD